MASVYRLQLPTLTVNDGSALSLVFRYFPDEAGLPEPDMGTDKPLAFDELLSFWTPFPPEMDEPCRCEDEVVIWHPKIRLEQRRNTPAESTKQKTL